MHVVAMAMVLVLEVQVQVASHRYHMVPTCLIFACIVEEKKALSCYLHT